MGLFILSGSAGTLISSPFVGKMAEWDVAKAFEWFGIAVALYVI